MKQLVKCNGFIGDHLFAAGIAQTSEYTDPVDYCVQVHQVMELFNNDPHIGTVMHISECTPEIEKQYDKVYNLPPVNQSFAPPLYFRRFCQQYTNEGGYKIYTNSGLDHSPRLFLPQNGKKNVAWQANWEERSFLYTEEEYKAGIDKPPAGYGGKRRNIDYIISELSKKFNMISVGFPNGTKNDTQSPMGGMLSAGIYSSTASLIKSCDWMIGGESGLINLAAGVGTNTIITGDFVHQLYGWNGCIKKIDKPQLGPEFYFENGHHSLDPFATDEEVVANIRRIINE